MLPGFFTNMKRSCHLTMAKTNFLLKIFLVTFLDSLEHSYFKWQNSSYDRPNHKWYSSFLHCNELRSGNRAVHSNDRRLFIQRCGIFWLWYYLTLIIFILAETISYSINLVILLNQNISLLKLARHSFEEVLNNLI